MSEIHGFEDAVRSAELLRNELINGIQLHDDEYDLLTAAVFAGGHILWEGAPGTAKTVASKAIAKAIGGEVGRVQGTPDVMPTDITGGRIFNQKTGEFDFNEGPVFKEVLHVDELNRIPAKSQAALLEVIEEGQVTEGGKTYQLPEAQIVVATQNPKSYEQGSGEVIDALRDRFTAGLFTVQPDAERLKSIFQWKQAGHTVEADVLGTKDIQRVREQLLGKVSLTSDMVDLATKIMGQAVDHKNIDPSSILGYRAFESGLFIARSLAIVRGSQSVNGTDIQNAFRGALPHRVNVAYGAKETAPQLIDQVIRQATA
jgi:MoxR-like ATPase